MEISIFDPDTFDIHVNKKELLELYDALDFVGTGPGYDYMIKKIEETIEEVNKP